MILYNSPCKLYYHKKMPLFCWFDDFLYSRAEICQIFDWVFFFNVRYQNDILKLTDLYILYSTNASFTVFEKYQKWSQSAKMFPNGKRHQFFFFFFFFFFEKNAECILYSHRRRVLFLACCLLCWESKVLEFEITSAGFLMRLTCSVRLSTDSYQDLYH